MAVQIRRVGPGDPAALRGLYEVSGVAPAVDRITEQQQDSCGEEGLRRWVTEEAGEAVGGGALIRSAWHPPGAYQAEVIVRPSARRRGLGSALTRRVLAGAEEVGARELTAWVDGGVPEFERFAAQHGFGVVQRFVTMTLEVGGTDEGLLDRLVRRARGNGFSLFTFEDTGATAEARRKLYALNRRLAPLLPGNGDEFPTFDEYEREIIGADWFRPQGQLIAAHGDHWVGLVGLGFYEERRRLHHEFTAVDPAYQGRGIALALKAWSVQKARLWGAREIRTGNDATNAVIIGVNRRLGYVLRPGVVKLRRALG